MELKVQNCWGNSRKKRPFSNGLFSIQSEGLVWNHPQGVWNPSQSDGMAYSLLAHRLHGGTSCYVPSLTERSQSNLHSLADKQACRLASLDYHAPACIPLRIDSIQGYALILKVVILNSEQTPTLNGKNCIVILNELSRRRLLMSHSSTAKISHRTELKSVHQRYQCGRFLS